MTASQPLVNAIDGAGYRLTEPRRAVADLIAAREGHFTANDLIEDARARKMGIGRATIYRKIRDYGLEVSHPPRRPRRNST